MALAFSGYRCIDEYRRGSTYGRPGDHPLYQGTSQIHPRTIGQALAGLAAFT